MSVYLALAKVNVVENIKSKGGFNYLSWPYAISELLKNYPEATWTVHDFPQYSDGNRYEMPFLKTEIGYFVKVSVTIEGITRSQLHPILDYRNQSIDKPTTFEINSSIQRCLVKAIALHGLGLNIYAGEDLPMDAPAFTEEQQDQFFNLLEDNDELGMYSFIHSLDEKELSGLYSTFPKGQKTKSKEKIRDMSNKTNSIINEATEQLKTCVQSNDKDGITEIMDELKVVKKHVWDRLDNDTQAGIRDILA